MKQAIQRLIVPILTVAWMTGALAGFWAMEVYETTPGAISTKTLESGADSEISALPVLTMFVHPQCPCSKASLAELSEVVAEVGAKVQVNVLFVQPSDAPDDFTEGALWDLAKKLPEVRVGIDQNGILANRWGALTSGHTVLQDTQGNVVFNGGITRARGVAGDSQGKRSVVGLLVNTSSLPDQAAVFGCPLFSPDDSCSQGASPCPSQR